MTKRTFKPSKRKRSRRHGFLGKMKTEAGQKTIKRRRDKGRKRLGA